MLQESNEKEGNMRNIEKQGYGGDWRDIKTDIPTIPSVVYFA